MAIQMVSGGPGAWLWLCETADQRSQKLCMVFNQVELLGEITVPCWMTCAIGIGVGRHISTVSVVYRGGAFDSDKRNSANAITAHY
jgi:hypothetical protein